MERKLTFSKPGPSRAFSPMRGGGGRVLPRLAALALAGGAGLAAMSGPAPGPPIVLIVADTLRADRLGAYGYGLPTSPRLDSLAAESVLYEAALTPAPLTMPAVAGLMTGRYPETVGVASHSRADRLAAQAHTLAEAAHLSGYRRAAVVSNPWLARPAMGFSQGFETFVTAKSGAATARLDASTVTDLAIDLLPRISSAPFLLWVHYMDTHMPYNAPAELAARFGNRDATSRVLIDFADPGTDRQTIYFEPGYEPGELEDTRRLYDAAVAYVDREVGRLLDHLRELGVYDDAIIIFLSDHGESLGDHGLFFAHDFTVYEELVRVPLIIRLPGGRPLREPSVVSLLDVFPTLCAAASLSCAASGDGVDLMSGGRAGRQTVARFAATAPLRKRYQRNPWAKRPGLAGRTSMLRRGNIKLLRFPLAEGQRYEAYDLVADPQERRDLYGPGRFRAEQLMLDAWLADMRRRRAPRSRDRGSLDRETVAALRSLGYLDGPNSGERVGGK